MSDHKIRPLEDLTRLLCKQVTDWDKARLSVRGQKNEDAKSAFSNAYKPLHEPLTKEILTQLSTDTKINNIEAHKAILSLVLPHKSAETVAGRTKDGTIPVATIEGFRSIISFLASTLLSWSDRFEQCQKIEDDEEFKYFMVMRIPVIQGSQNQWDFRDIGKQPFDKSECALAIGYLKSSASTHVKKVI